MLNNWTSFQFFASRCRRRTTWFTYLLQLQVGGLHSAWSVKLQREQKPSSVSYYWNSRGHWLLPGIRRYLFVLFTTVGVSAVHIRAVKVRLCVRIVNIQRFKCIRCYLGLCNCAVLSFIMWVWFVVNIVCYTFLCFCWISIVFLHVARMLG